MPSSRIDRTLGNPSEPRDDWDDEPTYPNLTRPRARVLLVEDDAVMRGLVRGQLVRDGYDVFEAETGGRALEVLGMMREHGWPADDVDLIFMDIHMPGPSGIDVLHQLRSDRVATPVVLMTGFAAEPELASTLDRLDAKLLTKPFALECLSDVAISSILAALASP